MDYRDARRPNIAMGVMMAMDPPTTRGEVRGRLALLVISIDLLPLGIVIVYLVLGMYLYAASVFALSTFGMTVFARLMHKAWLHERGEQ